MPTQKRTFDHERLNVYHESLRFVTWTTNLLTRVPRTFSVNDQLDRASTSIPLNIAEGSGKFTIKDRCRFYDNARGSGLECAAALDVLVAKGILSAHEVLDGREMLISIVSMLFGLLKSISPDRLCEEPGVYMADVAESLS